jgi:homogentisate 1,2-dioxygenase
VSVSLLILFLFRSDFVAGKIQNPNQASSIKNQESSVLFQTFRNNLANLIIISAKECPGKTTMTSSQEDPKKSKETEARAVSYQTGFGNAFESEAVQGALPKGRNNPKRVPFDLYSEQLSGTAFTRPRHVNQRTWLYRKQPSVVHNSVPFSCTDDVYFGNEDPAAATLDPNPLRWAPFFQDHEDNNTTNTNNTVETKDFVSGTHLLGVSGEPTTKNGLAIYVYMFQKDMSDSYMYNSDGDFLLLPQVGGLEIRTEVGKLIVGVGEICMIPRGLVFSVHDDGGGGGGGGTSSSCGFHRGYLLEIYKGHFTLPELGPIGANGLANARDFEYPVAWYEEEEEETNRHLLEGGKLYNKFGSKLWGKPISSTPFNVVAWHGNYLPYKYDLSKFCAVNSVTYDHIDPSIYTVLTCAGDETGTALCDFVIFPPRWMSTDPNTFRPPWFHRNTMTEFMGLIHGGYDAKKAFLPGGASLHSCMTPHGPDAVSHDKAVADPCDSPTYFSGGLAFMFETSCILRLSKYALEQECMDAKYGECWNGVPNRFVAPDNK